MTTPEHDLDLMNDQRGDRPSNPGIRLAFISLIPITAIVLMLLVFSKLTDGGRDNWFAEATQYDFMEVKGFSFVDQYAQPVDRSLFEGEWTVLTFVFTRCPLICPQTIGNLYTMSQRLENTRVRFAVLTIDPVHDTPEVMRSYLDRLGFDPEKTTALIPPDAAAARAFMDDGLKLGLDVDEEMLASDDAEVLQQITHSTRFLLIGPDAKVRDMKPGDDYDEVVRFADAIRNQVMVR
ncbi:MAG: SCO family protein [Planctomycetota bacterium]